MTTILKASSQIMLEILESANKGLATNKKLGEVKLVFLEEDNSIENIIKGIYRYRVVEKERN
jgi:hypothetical protein